MRTPSTAAIVVEPCASATGARSTATSAARAARARKLADGAGVGGLSLSDSIALSPRRRSVLLSQSTLPVHDADASSTAP